MGVDLNRNMEGKNQTMIKKGKKNQILVYKEGKIHALVQKREKESDYD